MNRLTESAIVTVAIAAVIGVFLIDMVTPLGFAIWIMYFLPLLVTLLSHRPGTPLMVVGIILVALFLGFHLSYDGLSAPIAASNRSMAAAVMVGVAFVLRYLIIARNNMSDDDWVQRGQVDLARAIQGDAPSPRLAANLLEVLGTHIGARAGVVYLRRGAGLVRIGAWGANPADLPAELPEDIGHLGRALRENRLIELDPDPAARLAWSTGLMQGAAPRSVLLPLREGMLVNGVLELGFDRPLRPATVQLLERVSDKIGIALRSAEYRARVQELLEETTRQAEELRSHGEELSASNTELEEQAEELRASQRQLEEQQSELEEQNAQLESQAQQLEDQRDALARSRRQLEEQAATLARESRYKSEFVANMSHELRTPLNALLIMSRLLAENRGKTLTDEQIRWAQTIESSGQDLLTLINDILDLSKIEAGKLDIDVVEVDPKTVARKLLRGFETQARTKGLELRTDFGPGLATLMTDVTRLEQVLRNFLSNAVKFTDKGHVTLRIEPQGNHIAFAVQDTGIGIAATQQDAVFEAFRQADGTISRRYGGTGLGLSISRDLAALLGGQISLQSAPGQGSTFTLLLPKDGPSAAVALPPPPVTPALPSPAAVESLRGTVQPLAETGFCALDGVEDDRDRLQPGDRIMLAVEDDPAFARVLCDLAHDLGFRCLCVGRAEDAIRAARQYLPQAIVLDVGLPDHSGLTVLDQLKRDVSTRHIPVHMVSANDYTREALAQGAISYMLKPVERDELATAIQKLEQRLEQRMRRVLIVEDDPVQLDGLRSLLSSDEVETVGAISAAEAIVEFGKGRFDCIVLDMTLPDASGFDVLERLDADDGNGFPPVIIYTARSLSEAEEQRLRRYSKSIIIKGAKSPERLIDEVTLFLHQVVSDLPSKQREMLAASLNRDAMLEGRRILVVEDDIRNIYALTGIFEPHGATVQIARNGREALEALGRIADGAQPKVDLVLMDVMMPEMDGLTATREIRKIDRWKTLPVIMLTAKAMAGDQNECMAAGANDYLAKPIDVDKLLSLARVWIAR
ncbi:response regulator [Neotabrizicola sp. VNH66]